MNTNRTSDVVGSACNVVHMPSGFEVESARLHAPAGGHSMTGSSRSAWREKLANIRTRGMDKMSSVRETVSTRVGSVKPLAHRKIESLRSQLRSNPGKWAGAAVGAGFGVGLLGRLMLSRAQNRSMPEVIVISSACS